MIVVGNIATTLTPKTATTSGRKYYEFRLAESYGRRDDENRQTVWYTVRFFAKDDLSADLLSKGQLVEVKGKLDARAYKRKDSEELAVDLTVITSTITPVERKAPAEG